LCFAVSSNISAHVAGQIIMKGKVRRAYLGIAGNSINLSERIVAANKLTKRSGIYIFEVVADAPAYNSEIKTGDILVEFNHGAVGTIHDLHKLLDESAIGRSVEVGVLRNNRKIYLRAIPSEFI
ncbi:MAG: PDZ domain-containing protein, partial [Chitinophagales bacterium]|nr:PDZ domain-containing protein [Chitinophagales bacterium]